MADAAKGDDQGLQLAGLAPLGPGTRPPSPGSMRTELESMRDFKKRVDGLLQDLSGSEAEPASMADGALPAATLGTGFAEATGLHQAYTQVHDQLVMLSRILSGQIGALSTAVEGSRKGYEAIDLDTRDRMWAIQTAAQQHYDPKLDPYAEEHGGSGGQGDQGNQAGDRGDQGAQQTGTGPGDDGAGL